MKDLKHLIFFEELLRSANNELVRRASQEGERALGYTCYFVPETLLNLPGCFSTRLRAPGSNQTDIGTYYMTTKTCPYSRAILERAVEGGYDHLTALFSSETCSMMHRAHEYFEMLDLVRGKNPAFFMTMMDVPFVTGPAALEHYEGQLQKHILSPLRMVCGVDTSDAALREAIELHNRVSRCITEMGDMRKAENPAITGYELHVIQLVSQVCPQKLILPYLEETLEELKAREPEAKPWFRARVVLAGGEIDDPEFTRLLESCGALVAADRYCYGTLPSREEIAIRDGESPLAAIARHYMETSQCPRWMSRDKMDGRREYLKYLCDEYKADGVLIEAVKFCEYWGYERILASAVLDEKYGIPVATIEKDYAIASAGQLRTRFQAFVESLEIKKLQGGAK